MESHAYDCKDISQGICYKKKKKHIKFFKSMVKLEITSD